MPSVILSPGLLWSFRRWFVPLQPVGDAVHMYDHRRIQNMRELTYPKRHVSTKKSSLVPRQDASKARRRSSAHPIQLLSPALCSLSDISRFRIFLSVINSAEDERREGGVGTNCVLRRQKLTLLWRPR